MGSLTLHSRILVPIFVLFCAFVLNWPLQGRNAASPHFNVKEVTAIEAKALMDAGAVVIDVRDRSMSGATHLPGAMLIPLEVLEANLAQLEAARAKSIIVYCGDGSTRGPEAAALLNKAGFAGAVNLKPGIEGWRSAGLPTATG